MRQRRITLIGTGLALVIWLAGCGEMPDLAEYLPEQPSPVPTLARLPTVTPIGPTPTPLPTIPPIAIPPTPEPQPTLTATAVLNANVRNGPGTDFAIVGTALAGSVIELLSARDGWYQVITAEGVEGWMADQVLEVDPDTAAAVPLANVP